MDRLPTQWDGNMSPFINNQHLIINKLPDVFGKSNESGIVRLMIINQFI